MITRPGIATLLLIVAAACGGHAQTVKLRIEGSGLRDGVPERISFVFVNAGDQNLSIPPLSPCSGRYSGHLTLMLNFSPLQPQVSGKGGGCGGAVDHHLPILDQARAWKVVPPHSSFAVTYARSELFDYQQAAGVYLYSGRYDPPQLSAAEVLMLEGAGIIFPSEALVSEGLRFARPQ